MNFRWHKRCVYTTSELHLRVQYKTFGKQVLCTNAAHPLVSAQRDVVHDFHAVRDPDAVYIAHDGQREYATGRKVKHCQLVGPHLPGVFAGITLAS